MVYLPASAEVSRHLLSGWLRSTAFESRIDWSAVAAMTKSQSQAVARNSGNFISPAVRLPVYVNLNLFTASRFISKAFAISQPISQALPTTYSWVMVGDGSMRV